MSPEQLQKFKELLEKFRRDMVSAGDQKAEPIHQDAERPDEDGQPLTEMSQAISSSRNQNRSVVLGQISAALSKIQLDPDDYGVCDQCDEDIPHKRLEIMPWSTSCVRCLSKKENPLRGATRRNLTDFVS
ncbi:MAG: TraR/DksA family transcriptional regulator [Deltaproteobacteria bacterium]|jgi:DnaK suppressor protein|nr:TraR/DksA family transcriptional regulator [Deltaproteobacteria bacterium]